MAYIPNQQINTGSYVPTTNIWDVGRLYEVDVNSDEFKELLVRLYQNINNIALVLNTKVTGYNINQEFLSGKLFYDPANVNTFRNGYLKTVNTGPLGAGVTSIDHNIPVTALYQWMFISGAATDTVTLVGYPIPYADAAGNNIQVSVTATQVVINNNSGITFTDSQVTLEYCKF